MDTEESSKGIDSSSSQDLGFLPQPYSRMFLVRVRDRIGDDGGSRKQELGFLAQIASLLSSQEALGIRIAMMSACCQAIFC